MSFILDALKRSENERQEQAGAEFAAVPNSPDTPGAPRWLWVLGALLAVNAVVLLGLMFRPERAPEPVVAVPLTPVVAQQPAAATTSAPSFDEQVAEARRNRPTPDTSSGLAEATTVTASPPGQAARGNVVATDNLRVTRVADLPTLTELRANGSLQLPDLHLDIHVFNELPSERFVFINMDKYQEGSQLSAGPVVQEITNDGVILEHENLSFLLLRD